MAALVRLQLMIARHNRQVQTNLLAKSMDRQGNWLYVGSVVVAIINTNPVWLIPGSFAALACWRCSSEVELKLPAEADLLEWRKEYNIDGDTPLPVIGDPRIEAMIRAAATVKDEE